MTTLHNPLINGFHPDSSVVAVDGAYYLATSTFEYLPGIPIHRSVDFETWELIGHVATRPGQLGVDGVPTGGGAWAPTIRHHGGVFHLVITDAMGRGMLHFTATDAAGPWSDGDLLLKADGSGTIEGIDPDIAWDAAGTCYVTFSGLQLSGALDPNQPAHLGIQQVRVDLESHRALEEPRSLWSGTGLMFPEAPHLYEIEGAWYLLIAEGGTERGHAISIARGDAPTGPFTGAPDNPLVSARSTPRPVQNTGHGDIVRGPGGEWLCVLLGVRPRSGTRAFSALGRETFVTPVTWTDGWPSIAPVELAPRPGTHVEIDFSQPLDGEWIAVRRLPSDVSTVTDGRLVLTADGSTLAAPQPVFVGRRQEHLTNEVTVALDVSNGIGGIAVRYDEGFRIELEAGGAAITARALIGGLRQEWAHPFQGGSVVLHLASRKPAGGGGMLPTSDVFHLAATIDGERIELAEIDGRFLSSEVTESFTGRVIGVYAVDGEVAVSSWVADGDDD
ncbi:glycoside hydrolase family 43 protein [Microbacterium sp. B35-30]|uniref:glycoside hydrolase family 43 protein n=1 Tax=Microbacterium sp. B35-30 TaxID=1962642 RepID=UPI0013D49F1D|nr:glycoside hydrolase family 43 protein [Microbacterium sp. B35-30]KAF2418576.1 glycoside hydrolase 43 family protein [Microbacterium sp. B35-30]